MKQLVNQNFFHILKNRILLNSLFNFGYIQHMHHTINAHTKQMTRILTDILVYYNLNEIYKKKLYKQDIFHSARARGKRFTLHNIFMINKYTNTQSVTYPSGFNNGKIAIIVQNSSILRKKIKRTTVTHLFSRFSVERDPEDI